MKIHHNNGSASRLANSLLHPGQGASDDERHQMLLKQSHRLVSQTFFGAMLKQMRNSPFKSNLLDGGRGGQAFSSMLDQHLADRMAVGSGNKLANAIVNKIEHKKPHEKQEAPAENAATRQIFKRSPYAKQPAGNRRPYVPADFRA